MTYFDRDLELLNEAVATILEALGDSQELHLKTPFSCLLQTGKEATITGFKKEDAETITVQTLKKPIPPIRMEVSDLLELVETQITTKQFKLS